MRRAPLLLSLLLVLPLPFAAALAQEHVPALSDAEVDKLRDAAQSYPERVQLFTDFLDSRTKDILSLTNGRRHAGRELDIHERMEQFTSIADDLEDNLDDYGSHHRDIRQALPKLLAATDRWQSALRTPPDNPAYDVSRKLALEAVKDLHDDVAKLIDDQKSWFLAHPPDKPKPSPYGRG